MAQISEDVLAALSLATVDTTGAVSIDVQLERKLYQQVNAALEACGFKWSRRFAAHVAVGPGFGPDVINNARGKLERLLITGDIETKADIGFFETPAKLAVELVAMADVRPGHTALEPSAGTGRIARALVDAGAVTTVIERDKAMRNAFLDASMRYFDSERAVHVTAVSTAIPPILVSGREDFMTYESDDWFDRIVMNPPFCKVGIGDHLMHVQYAYDGFLKPGGKLVAVLPAGVVFRQDKRHKDFRRWATERGGELTPLPDGSFKESGTNVRTVVLRMHGADHG